MKLVYIAHPYGGNPENLKKARVWLKWANSIGCKHGFFAIAPWITICEDAPERHDAPELREHGLLGDCELVSRCDEIWLCGPEISPGMKREAEAAEDYSVLVRIFTCEESPPPWEYTA